VKFKNVFRIARKLKPKDQMKLVRKLKTERMNEILNTLKEQFKNTDVTFDEITEAVEKVRKGEYSKRQAL
jgi:hypothetical protein